MILYLLFQLACLLLVLTSCGKKDEEEGEEASGVGTPEAQGDASGTPSPGTPSPGSGTAEEKSSAAAVKEGVSIQGGPH
ncbi:hypothetical protein Y032_0001g81 [Ancylostoma ceylanicum]|nr:hypothetical protein Y032_0001g81 [Ancylostoma ceylanicum]